MLHVDVALTTTILLTLFSSFSNAVGITQALQAYPALSNFVQVINNDKALEDLLNSGQSKTIFAPSNSALTTAFMTQMPLTDQQALLRYHILNGSYPATELATPGGATLPTYLEGNQFAVLGGQPNVVYVSKFGDSGQGNETATPQVFSGLGQASAMQAANITYDGGLIYVVESLFALPENCTSTAQKDNWNALVTALTRTNLTTYLDTTPRITCFAPSDDAFSKAGSPEKNLPPAKLAEALQYHTLQGSYIGYTDSWKDGQELTTLSGDSVVVTRAKGAWWVNGVKVLKANVITSNGVAHVLDGVLNPAQKSTVGDGNSTTTPNTTTGSVSPNNTATTSAPPSSSSTQSGARGNKAAASMVLWLAALFAYFAL